MSGQYVPLPEGQVPVEEFFAKAAAGDLPPGYELQADGTVKLPDGSVVDKDGVRNLPDGHVLLPTDELGFVDIDFGDGK